MSDETAFARPATVGQVKDIAATLVQAIPQRLSFDEAQQIIGAKGWLLGEVQKLLTRKRVQEQLDNEAQLAKARADRMVADSALGTALQIEEWVQFYYDVFDLNIHYSQIKMPVRGHVGFHRLIVVAQGLTLKRIIQVTRKYISVESYELRRYFYGDEETRGKHDRLPTETYAVWVRDKIDPDAERADMPSRLLVRRGVQGITLLEHLLFHLKYFRESGRLLDRNELSTMCLGSRDLVGCIPYVYGTSPVKVSHTTRAQPSNCHLQLCCQPLERAGHDLEGYPRNLGCPKSVVL